MLAENYIVSRPYACDNLKTPAIRNGAGSGLIEAAWLSE